MTGSGEIGHYLAAPRLTGPGGIGRHMAAARMSEAGATAARSGCAADEAAGDAASAVLRPVVIAIAAVAAIKVAPAAAGVMSSGMAKGNA